jgi:hypothetical protein
VAGAFAGVAGVYSSPRETRGKMVPAPAKAKFFNKLRREN